MDRFGHGHLWLGPIKIKMAHLLLKHRRGNLASTRRYVLKSRSILQDFSRHALSVCSLLLALVVLNSCDEPRESRNDDINEPAPPERSSSVTNPEIPQERSREVISRVVSGVPVLVTIGGWNSCAATDQNPVPNPYGMNHYANFSKMKDRIAEQTSRPIRFVAACFTASMNKVRYLSSSAPTTLREGPVTQLYEEIDRQVSEAGGLAFINGHSYGGWYAMQAALALPDSVKIALLSTMDPISPETCKLTDMSHTVSALVEMRLPPPNPGCNSSPADVTAEQKNKIRSRVTHWENFFQVDFFKVLHATSIPEAHGNTEYQYPFPASINGHIKMGLDEKVWLDWSARVYKMIQTN
jgi:hypothetical protein